MITSQKRACKLIKNSKIIMQMDRIGNQGKNGKIWPKNGPTDSPTRPRILPFFIFLIMPMFVRHVILPITRQKRHVICRVFKILMVILLAISYDTSYDLELVVWGLIVPQPLNRSFVPIPARPSDPVKSRLPIGHLQRS